MSTVHRMHCGLVHGRISGEEGRDTKTYVGEEITDQEHLWCLGGRL